MFFNRNYSYLYKSLFVFFLKIFGALLSFVVTAKISKNYGLDDAGFYFTFFAFFMLSCELIKLGSDNVIVKSVSISFSTNRLGEVKYLLNRLVLVFFLISFCYWVVTFLFTSFFSNYFSFSQEVDKVIYYFGIGIFGFVCFYLFSNFLIALSRPYSAVLMVSILPPLIILCYIHFFSQKGESVAELINFYYVSVFFAALFVFFWLCIWLRRVEERFYSVLNFLKESRLMFVGALSDLFISYSPIFVLSLFSGNKSVAIYSICLRIATILAFVFTSLNTVVSPIISVSLKKKDYINVKKLIKVNVVSLLFCTFVFMFLCFFYSDFVLGFFGAELESFELTKLLMLVVLFKFLSSVYLFFRTVIQLSGNYFVAKKYDVYNALICVVFLFILVPLLGVEGAIYAPMVSFLIAFFFLIKVVRETVFR